MDDLNFDQQLMQELTNRQFRKRDNVERIYSRKAVERAFLETFELIGGVPRLALWANDPENYGEFIRMFSKFAPKESIKPEGSSTIQYISNVPPSPLNRTKEEETIVDVEPEDV